jgi:hypothetical protein
MKDRNPFAIALNATPQARAVALRDIVPLIFRK